MQPMDVPRPTPRLGDRWVFRTALPGRQGLVLEHRLDRIAADGGFEIRVRKLPDGQEWLRQQFDAEFNRVSREIVPGEAVRFDPPFALFRFPMRAGLSWQASTRQQQDGGYAPRRVDIEARVVGEESVDTPAGRLSAWRIEAVHRAGDTHIDTVYWYCPQAKRSVRGEETTRTASGTSLLIYELLEFSVS
jgi:hypothetical protein